MIIFIVGSLLLLFFALLIIWLPFARRNKKTIEDNCRQKTNSKIYQQQIATVTQQFDQHDPLYKLLRNELALGLLTEETEREPKTKPESKSIVLPVFMSIFVIGLPLIGYGLLGQYNQVNVQQDRQDPFVGLSDKEIKDIKLIELQDKIKANPQDTQSWFILAEYYLYHNEFDNALIVLDKITAIEGENNEILAARALVLYYQNGQSINLQIRQLLDYILQKEPLQITALMLIASDYYYHAQYKEAIDIWQRLLDSGNPKIDRVMLIERINVAKMMAGRE